MRFDMNRICKLAGVRNHSNKRRGSGLIREQAGDDLDFGAELNEEDEEDLEEEGYLYEEDEEDLEEEDEFVEVDEKELVQELRRMKRIMTEAKKKSVIRSRRKKQNLQEMQLKAMIDQEVKNVLKDLNLNSGWVYGNNKPQRSRKGYVNHGSYLKGIGFK